MASPVDNLNNRLKIALTKRNMKPVELSEKTKIPKSSISQYMSGYAKPNGERIYLISAVLDVNEAWLLGFDVPMERKSADMADRFPSPNITEDYTTFPVIGEIAAGYDHIAAEDWDSEKIDIPNKYLKGRNKTDFFVLLVTGESMFPTYQDGDKVLILKQSTLNYSGQIGAVLYDDEYATLKKIEYVYGEDWMRLVPVNPNIPPTMIEGERLEHCRVLGIPKLLIREIK